MKNENAGFDGKLFRDLRRVFLKDTLSLDKYTSKLVAICCWVIMLPQY